MTSGFALAKVVFKPAHVVQADQHSILELSVIGEIMNHLFELAKRAAQQGETIGLVAGFEGQLSEPEAGFGQLAAEGWVVVMLVEELLVILEHLARAPRGGPFHAGNVEHPLLVESGVELVDGPASRAKLAWASFKLASARRRLSSARLALRSARRHCQTTPRKPASKATASEAASPATRGLRRHHRQTRSGRPTGRAWIGSPPSQRRKSFANAPGGLVAPRRLPGHRLQADRLQVAGDLVVETAGAIAGPPRSPGARPGGGRRETASRRSGPRKEWLPGCRRRCAGRGSARLAPARGSSRSAFRPTTPSRVKPLGAARARASPKSVILARSVSSVDQDVAGLDVAMNQAGGMSGVECKGDLGHQGRDPPGAGRSVESMSSARVGPGTYSITRYGKPSGGSTTEWIITA